MKELRILLSLALVTFVTGRFYRKHQGISTWGYWECRTGVYCPSSWSRVNPQCGGSMQSPIDIVPMYTQTKLPCKPLQMESDNDFGLVQGVLANIGHTVQFSLNENAGSVYLSGGPADTLTYKLSNIQFHFGCTSKTGSEHTFGTDPSAAEMHMVFYNSKYRNMKEALNQTEGILIVASLFTAYGGPTYYVNPVLERFMEVIPNITTAGSYVTFDSSNRIELTKLVTDLKGLYPLYYTYKGSLTTPPCYETVTWVILKNKLTISLDQLALLNDLRNSRGVSQCDNYRPVQPVNNRVVTKNFN